MYGRATAKSQHPHSALTDFLASNNISAAQIQDDYNRRVAEAARAEADEEEQQEEQAEREADPDHEELGSEVEETPEEKTRKRKRQQAIEKLKRSKEFARRKARRTGDPGDDADADEALADQMMSEKSRPIPGQLENCEICGKRFTVTPYSKTGPEGGLLCASCSKNQKEGNKKAPPKKRNSGISRRQNQNALLDGHVRNGPRSLLEICIKKVADNIDDVEEFGDLPPPVMLKISHILSRRRAITPKILDLFLRPHHRTLDIYDCAKLDTNDYHKILATMPSLTRLNLRFVTPMKDQILEYMIDKDIKLEDLHLDSPNLLWNLDSAFDDETAQVMAQSCRSLQRLKLKYFWKLGDEALRAISAMETLEHLSLQFMQETQPESILHLVSALGPNLRSLSLENFELADDRLVQGIHNKCRNLYKFRLTHNSVITDQALAELFRGWSNPALSYIDFSSLRDVDMANPDGPEEPIGLASNGFMALMEHSGSKLKSLNVSSCRHINRDAYEEVFGPDKRYPQLKSLDISFDGHVDDFIAQSIFRCCPALKKMVVFGCFKIRDLVVPKDVAVIGTVGAKLTVDGAVQV
ncbi:hypothetical protein N7470_001325 [Penicillium chermesinum]|nr:hypothetical protein N7470_001325 [Penicillium chermesinum]